MGNLFIVVFLSVLPSLGRIDKLPRVLAEMPPDSKVLAWVDFTGEGEVPDSWVREVARTGARVRVRSRWFRSVSVRATRRQLEKIVALPFVRRICPVARFKRSRPLPSRPLGVLKPLPDGGIYGPSYAQVAMLGIPRLHEMGLSGKGVRIAVLDAGFDTTHPAVRGLKILAFRDFVQELAEDTLDTSPTLMGDNHGLAVLSVLGGYDEGHLVGPAYGAEFILARTENTAWEWPLEEDAWIAAAEWADSLGADIISSSVGYTTWDDGTGYSPEDLDGDTPRITQAADEAVRRGILVVAAAGNEAQTEWGSLLCPADGDSVIAVGAVDRDRKVASFSSRGPTADGRIKPDLAALGVDVTAAWKEDGELGYRQISGTSFAAPLVAGLAALILQAHPDWEPIQVREALKRAGDRVLAPNDDVGWGVPYGPSALEAEETLYGRIVDEKGSSVPEAAIVLKAGDSLWRTTSSQQGWFLMWGIPPGEYELEVWSPFYASYTARVLLPEWDELRTTLRREGTPPPTLVCAPNPVGPEGAIFSFPLRGKAEATLRIFSPSGELVWSWVGKLYGERGVVRWEARNMDGRPIASGIYLCMVEVGGKRMATKVGVVR